MLNQAIARACLLMESTAGSFVWAENVSKVIITCLLSMVPAFEGRYAITIMVGMNMPVGIAFLLALVFSTIPMPLILLLLRPVLDWFYTLPIPPVRKFAAWVEHRSDKKRAKMTQPKKGLMGWLSGRMSAETLELVALYAFVAVPLPGTGVWTGSAIATLFEMPRGKSALAIFLGNVTACLIMTLTTYGAVGLVG